MTAHSHSRGHKIIWDENKNHWIEPVSGEYENDKWKCNACGKAPVRVDVRISADLSETGKPYYRECYIDACIAPIIKALSDGGIKTKWACCGHKRYAGVISLDNDMELMIMTPEQRKHLCKAVGNNEGIDFKTLNANTDEFRKR